MSLFMALAVRGVSQDRVREKIALPFRTVDASAMPLGQAAVGRWKNSGCVLVEVGFGSANVVGKNGKGPRNDLRNEFARLVIKLQQQFGQDVAVVYHLFRGLLTQERVQIQAEVQVAENEIEETCQVLQEDVRYVFYVASWPSECQY
ncbi:MAG TPA: hypothetical protein VHE55_07805 [Fimbriimonadaceae bacterium]|nr:hypothetical protein [Fimbriimonadaceae bacterium]